MNKRKGVNGLMNEGGKNGQTTAEYAVVIGLVIAAVVAMQVYVKRSFQAKIKDTTDFYTSQESAKTGSEEQYEPYYASSDYKVKQDTDSTEEMQAGGKVSRTGIAEETKRLSGGKTETADFTKGN